MRTFPRRSFLAFTVLLAPALAGRSTARAQDKVTLTFWNGFTGGDRPTYEALVARFNETHPTIEVVMDIQPWDTLAQKLPAALATGQGPDLATPDYNVATIRQYAAAGTIMPIDDAYGTGPGRIDTAAMPPAVIDGFTVDGKIYAAPANFATLLLYYNRDLLAEAGIAEPPATMAEFRDAAVRLTKKDSSGRIEQYGLALADHQTIAMWPILIWAEGGDLVNATGCSALAEAETVAAVAAWSDLIITEGISPIGETGQGADNLFAAGKAAMEMNGPWAAGQYQTAGVNFDVAPIPVGPAGPVTLASTVPIVVSQSTAHQAEAYEFLAWWTGQDAQRELALGSGFPPVRTDMADDPALLENPLVPKFAAAAPYARFYLAKADNFAQIDADVISPAIGRATRGEPVDEVLAAAEAEMNELLGCSPGGDA
ncbi:MAG: ABC transporter substrate-binding protein [Chloroflexota bacterium]|nr:ABC transporter substrate-binding protein [Chloroflexota bacterium]